MFLSDTDYRAYYYYDKVMENSMFPLTLVSDNYTLMISYDLKYAMPSIFKLNECGFAKPFYDFASHLCDTDMVLSNDESIEFIENCIKDRL